MNLTARVYWDRTRTALYLSSGLSQPEGTQSITGISRIRALGINAFQLITEAAVQVARSQAI